MLTVDFANQAFKALIAKALGAMTYVILVRHPNILLEELTPVATTDYDST